MSAAVVVDAKKQVRVWIDGCFDLVHFGHANACRQAKQMGDELVVGVHSDEEIARNKGPTVFNLEERCELVRSIKWVDQVVPNAPYVTSVQTLDENNCDFCVHGDDITLACDGTDTYAQVKQSKRYRECKRTAGVSTTDIVGRMLLMTREHHIVRNVQQTANNSTSSSPYTKSFDFLASSKKISQFSSNKDPKKGDKISFVFAYVDGGFDLFHVGHVRFLKKAKELGDYLIVGLHSDCEINRIKGANYPIMNVDERLLSLLACKYVDEVFIGVPYTVSAEILDAVRPSVVAHGCDSRVSLDNNEDPYRFAKKRGLFVVIDSECDLTVERIIHRIMQNASAFEKRNSEKEKRECDCIEQNHKSD